MNILKSAGPSGFTSETVNFSGPPLTLSSSSRASMISACDMNSGGCIRGLGDHSKPGPWGVNDNPQRLLYTTSESLLWRPNEGVQGNRQTRCAPAVQARTKWQ